MLAVGVLQGIAAGSLLHVTFYEVKYLFLLHRHLLPFMR